MLKLLKISGEIRQTEEKNQIFPQGKNNTKTKAKQNKFVQF